VAADKCERDETRDTSDIGREQVLRVLDACAEQIDRPFVGDWPNPLHYARYIAPPDEDGEGEKSKRRGRKRAKKNPKDVTP
jgi:hypothetical protein